MKELFFKYIICNVLSNICFAGYGREICPRECIMVPGYTYCYQKTSQRQFTFQEEKACDQKRCTSKRKLRNHLNDISLQFDFLLKSATSLLIIRYTITFPYHNPHDWFDLILKEVNAPSEKYSTISEHSSAFHSFFTEIADVCNKIHMLQTANFIGEGSPTWGQTQKNFDSIPQNLSAEEHYEFVTKMSNKLKFVIIDAIHEQNRWDMLLYFIFPANNTDIDLLLNFKANYDIFASDDGFDMFWESNLNLNKDTPEYFLSLSAYYYSCLIQSKDKVMNGKLTLSWIPHLPKNDMNIVHEGLYYLYQRGKEAYLSWKEASSLCETNNSFLPILTSKTRQEQLIKLVDYLQLPIIFIGLYESKASTMLLYLNNTS